jgi:hypothetical protein
VLELAAGARTLGAVNARSRRRARRLGHPHKATFVLAAVALYQGLDEATTARVADTASVTSQEVTAAYLSEMRLAARANLLEPPRAR